MKIISVMLIILNIFPIMSFSAENSMQGIVSTVKKKLDIPEYYTEFHSDIKQSATETLYNMSWRGENSKGGGYVGVTADELGRIIYYNNYEYGSFEGDYKLAAFDYGQAEQIAYEQLKKICPEFAYSVRPKSRENYLVRNSDFYQIHFVRFENDVPYYDNYIIATVNARDNILSEFAVRWYDIINFPKPQGIITSEQAKSMLKKRIGISLECITDTTGKASLLYSVNKQKAEYINAFTGEINNTNLTWGKYFTGNTIFQTRAENRVAAGDLPPDLLSVTEVINGIRAKIKIISGYTLKTHTTLTDLQDNYYYKIQFANTQDSIINVEINAKTQEITRFSLGEDYGEDYGIHEQEALDKAFEFARDLAPEKIKICDMGEINKVQAENGGYNYRIMFTRYDTGIKYTDNGIVIIISAQSGRVLSFQTIWDNTLPDVRPDITEEEAFQALFSKGEYSVRYITISKSKIKIPKNVNDIDVRLVYDFLPEVPQNVNAHTGEVCYRNFVPFLKDTSEVFLDIEQHPSKKAIKTLLSADFFDYDKYFYPDNDITQAQYFNWLYKAIKNYVLYGDELYKELYQQSVLEIQEREGDATITFENAIKYAVRLLGFTKAAELKDTYKTNFIDEGAINPELIGYAAIAQGLGIVGGNAFVPKRTVTNSLAAEIIYNILIPRKRGENEN
ncbi:MAG: S-layer homology domain-containing protein [Clostridiaceae bacterium]|nr:S-layer homology domain-containing protein [Clostridiaceae bacterium]